MTQHVAIFDILQQYLRNNASFLLDSNLNKHSVTPSKPPWHTATSISIIITWLVLMESIIIIPNANTPNFKTNQALFICESFRTISHSQHIYVLVYRCLNIFLSTLQHCKPTFILVPRNFWIWKFASMS